MKITARAHTNIALIKYWGKRNEQLFLPMNNSISITLDQFYTTTSVTFRDDLKADSFILNGSEMGGQETDKISGFLDLIREKARRNEYAVIDSINNVPTAAGFASSASGFAALAAAATKAIGLNYSGADLSRISRFGSGSACRSIYGGFVEWNKGVRADGTDSFAEQIIDESEWDLSILSVMVESKPKKVLSREGMQRTVKTSAFYSGWLETIDADLNFTREAIQERDFEKLGTVLEHNALKMHATMLGANPPFFYWTGSTLDVMHKVQELRDSGIQAYFTIDAGPNVKVICQPEDERIVKESMQQIQSVRDVFVCHPGPGVSYIGE
ncbi:diphosphomevalonate decarboxylase [Sporosarcina thermotolerans]|uniref:diphosphomevalonate decarboxylase n=1 Tax=Sporosarcina thermotolerans TaxID=633404 RepID=A0AAW9A5U3_9BACL|nr:diphosphomevalonate decarboxylase [Sporosarcina thermotolerans]MDW0115459.1 diphosphomevalonate decarboxylase [Sporosarcina thermotolerans]WHT47213.1 diphosphomevalonate decarboxylase [Sporosarcina thermotolerans]